MEKLINLFNILIDRGLYLKDVLFILLIVIYSVIWYYSIKELKKDDASELPSLWVFIHIVAIIAGLFVVVVLGINFIIESNIKLI